MSESGDIGGRSFYRFLNRKFFSELGEAVHTDLLPLSSRSTLASPCSPIVTISSFLSFPVQSIWHCSSLFRKKPHAEGMDTAPAGRAVLLIPTPYFPVVGLSCFQFFPLKGTRIEAEESVFPLSQIFPLPACSFPENRPLISARPIVRSSVVVPVSAS